MDDTTQHRLRIAHRIHDLLLHELGEDMDVSLLLGPPEYARAVLSLCRACGSTELVRLSEQFVQASDAQDRAERHAQLRLPATAAVAPTPPGRRAGA
ncbi:MAG: hypothetical protein L6Q75_04665 [Burkholderiaceae bacterium]|nr:hypothetical protein [Burkholderiaceae bacterium]